MARIVKRTPAQVYELWVQALRSGEFEQGQQNLKYGGKFCCLGVLIELARRDGGREWEVENGYHGINGDFCHLPDSIIRFIGMEDAEESNLVSKNDNERRDFQYIANYIESVIAPRALARLAEAETERCRAAVYRR